MKLNNISTAELNAEIARREKARPKLEARRKALLAELDEIDAELGGSAPRRSGNKPGPKPGSTGRRRAKNEISLGDALAQAMEVRAVVSPSEAADYVKKNGYKTTSKNFNMMVSNALAKDPRFKRLSRGQYERIA
ncbi:MAG: hypothetical protein DHS20C15_02330 [Planctomycetota bacterium]|nr:MAG: hypothetical protein DHS20C15_02330 [Planctomycetota bacterium]